MNGSKGNDIVLMLEVVRMRCLRGLSRLSKRKGTYLYSNLSNMHITYISIFPDIFVNFCETSLVKKAQEKHILSFDVVDPRSFCSDTQKQVDDEIYGGGAGMLMKAQPVIDAVKYAMQEM